MPLAALDGEADAVVGSFTADGLTYAIDGEGQVALVAVAPIEAQPDAADATDVTAAAEGAPAAAEGATDGFAPAALQLPASVSYDGADYALVRIAPLALRGCGATALFVPASVEAIDTAAALGCDTLAEVAVDPGNPNLSTFDGYLTDKAQTSILLVPEGRVGQLRIASTIQDLDPRAFSHCTRLSSLDVDAGCPGLASWNGSIYTADLATLLRVPAGAAELTLPPECAAIGASALSGCTALRSISVQGSVGSIAPSAFGEIEEVQALPADAVSADASASADAEPTSARPVQITGLVAVASSALSAAQVDKSAIQLTLAEGSDPSAWESAGFLVGNDGPSEGEGDEASAVGIAEPESSTPGTLAASIISEKRQLTPEEAPAASMQEAIAYEADPSDPLYQRLLEKYKDDKFLDPDNGVTPESLAAGAYDALMKYGNQANAISPMYAGSAWWMFTEEDDGLLTLSIWCAAGGVIGQSAVGGVLGENVYVAWGAVRPYVERVRMLKVGETAPDGTVVAANNATLGSGQFNGQSGENVRTLGMHCWFSQMLRLYDVSDVYLTTEYNVWRIDTRHGCWPFDYVFEGCKSLIEVPGWKIPNGNFIGDSGANHNGHDIYRLFKDCDRLTVIGEGFSVSNVHGCDGMFGECPSLVLLPSTFKLSEISTYKSDVNYFGFPLSLSANTGFSSSSPLVTYWNGPESSLDASQSTAMYPPNSNDAKALWLNSYSRDLKGRQANSALFFIPRADATGDESVPSWMAVDAEGQPSTEAEQGIARNGDGTLARPADPISKRDGYGFVGWYKDPSYTELFDFKHDTVDDYACLWGKFEKGPYAITYLDGTDTNAEIADSAEVMVDPEFFLQPSYNYGERVVVDAVPVREGYEFLGWTIEGVTGDEPQKQAIIPAGTTGDKVAVAHWAKLPERNYLITTADAAAGYTVDNFPVATGVSSPKAWWTLDDKGELYIYCEPGATIAEANFAKWDDYSLNDDMGAWGAQSIRESVRSIVMAKDIKVEEDPNWSLDYSSSASTHSHGIGMSWWFKWMPNLSDISGVYIPSGLRTVPGLFYCSWGVTSLEGAHGTFRLPEGLINANAIFGFTGLESLPEDFSLPSSLKCARCMFERTRLEALPEGFSVPSGTQDVRAMFQGCWRLKTIPASMTLTRFAQGMSSATFLMATTPHARLNPEWVDEYKAAFDASGKVRTYYSGDIANLYPGATGKTAAETKAYWLNTWNRELVGPEDLVAPQSAVRFQVPKADGSGYTTYDVLADAAGRVTAPPVTKYGYSKVTWRYDTGTAGADLGHIAASGSCGQEGLSFDASALPSIKAGLKGPVYAEVSGLMLSMDMPVGSGNLWYAIDCGEVTALGSSASTRTGMADAHELKFESYTPIPTQLTATFTANDAPDGTPAVEKLFPNGLDAGTGFALALDGGASQSAGFKAMVDAGGSAAYDDLVELAASPSVQQPGQATGTLALKLGGTNNVDFEEETTNYSVADIVWTLDASAQYDFWVTDDAGTYSTTEIKAAADAISAYGTTDAVPAYRQYNRYLQQQSPDADPVLSIKVYDQGDGTASTHKVDVLGIAQDTKAIGGKAGLTFGFRDAYLQGTNECRMRSTATNSGGWNSSDLKKYLNGTFAGYLGDDVVDDIATVTKRQQQYGSSSLQVTSDAKLFVPSYFEVYGISYAYWNGNETASNSFQYEGFAKGGQATRNNNALKSHDGAYVFWWLRSASKTTSTDFARVSNSGVCDSGSVGSVAANSKNGVVPCFCF